MGRATSGVAGMKLRKGDEVIAIEVARDESDCSWSRTTATASGRASRSTRARVAHDGVLTIRLVESRGKLAGAMVVRDTQQVMLISVNGTATRTSVNGISRWAVPRRASPSCAARRRPVELGGAGREQPTIGGRRARRVGLEAGRRRSRAGGRRSEISTDELGEDDLGEDDVLE